LNFQHYKDLLNKQAGSNKEKQEEDSVEEAKIREENKFDFHLMACDSDMEFVPYSK
jgi:hypothetical protein